MNNYPFKKIFNVDIKNIGIVPVEYQMPCTLETEETKKQKRQPDYYKISSLKIQNHNEDDLFLLVSKKSDSKISYLYKDYGFRPLNITELFFKKEEIIYPDESLVFETGNLSEECDISFELTAYYTPQEITTDEETDDSETKKDDSTDDGDNEDADTDIEE